MQVVYSEDELLHNPAMELTNGEWKPYVGNKSFFELIFHLNCLQKAQND